jgi:acyl dehydratase
MIVFEGLPKRSLLVTEEHVLDFRRAFTDLDLVESGLRVEGSTIIEQAIRSGDTYLWHVEPGAVYRESRLLGARMEEAGVDNQARLAHGALGLMLALRDALLENPELAIQAVSDVRFATPIFEGAFLTVAVEPEHENTSAFVVTTDQIEPRLAITGHIRYGELADGYDDERFRNLAAQQLFSMEEVISAISALVGVGVQEAGARALYMGQSLELGSLVQVGDRLEVSAEVVDRAVSRAGERTTIGVSVLARREGDTVSIASGHSTILVMSVASTIESK